MELNVVNLVELVSQYTVPSPVDVVACGSSVFIGGFEAVTGWDTETGEVSELAEHRGMYFSPHGDGPLFSSVIIIVACL